MGILLPAVAGTAKGIFGHNLQKSQGNTLGNEPHFQRVSLKEKVKFRGIYGANTI